MTPDAPSDQPEMGGPHGDAGADEGRAGPDRPGVRPRFRHRMPCPVDNQPAVEMLRGTKPGLSCLPH
jgi:hypothetical protein